MKMPADFDWIIFDCFNTLIDDFDPSGDETGLGTIPEMAVSHGLFATAADFSAVLLEQRLLGFRHGREMLLDARLHCTLRESPTNPTPEQIDSVVKSMLKQWDIEYRALIRPTPGAAEAIEYWASRKKLGVLSNFFLPAYPAHYLQEYGWEAHFQFILDSAQFGYRKPHPRVYEEVFSLTGVKPQQAHRVLMIGDRLDLDLEGAQKCGMQVLHFNRQRTRPNIEETPEEIPRIYDWSEFR